MKRCRGISFETPAKVREQWGEEHGIPWFQSDEYTEALALTSQRYAVTMSKPCLACLLGPYRICASSSPGTFVEKLGTADEAGCISST